MRQGCQIGQSIADWQQIRPIWDFNKRRSEVCTFLDNMSKCTDKPVKVEIDLNYSYFCVDMTALSMVRLMNKKKTKNYNDKKELQQDWVCRVDIEQGCQIVQKLDQIGIREKQIYMIF